MDYLEHQAGWAEITSGLKGRELVGAFRHLCRNDLYFLLRFACGREDFDKQWLYERCMEVQASPDGHLDLWSRDHYKDIWVEEDVLTPDGWRKHGALRVGDWVYGSDGEPVKVIALSDRYVNSHCYEVLFDDGAKVICGAGHLWEVERRTKKRKKGGGRLYRERVVMPTHEMAVHNHSADNRLAVPVAPAVFNVKHVLRIEPYLLGLWLGDGTSINGMITSADPEVWGWIEEMGYSIGKSNKKGRTQTRTIYGLMPKLRAENLLANKHIPDGYLRSTIGDRRKLLQGLMDSDGHCHTNGTATFCNQNERLANQTFELCQSLGLKARIYQYDGELKPYWQVCFQAYKADSPFRLPRKLERCFDGKRKNPRRYIKSIQRCPTVPTSCIQVEAEDGIYLVGRNLVPTHNSSIITFGKTIQDILITHGEGAVGREVCVGLFSFSRKISRDFLKQIKRELESNERLKEWFPDILWENPDRQSAKWSDDEGIIVKRKSNPREATVEAWGVVESQPIGKHFNLMVYDDVVTEDSVNTPETIQKTMKMLELSFNLGSQGQEKRRFIGTRYHFNDAYSTLIDRGSVKLRLKPATEDGTMTGKPVFLSEEILAEKRISMGPYTYACQMLLNPVADESQGFLREWLKYHDGLNQHSLSSMNVYILVDPANSKKKGSDYTSFWVIGLGHDQNYYVVDMVRDRLSLPQRARTLMDLHKKYRPIRKGVRYERYGMNADIDHIRALQAGENYRFDIVEVGGSTAKNDRIARLLGLFEGGKVYLPRQHWYTQSDGKAVDLTKAFIEEEYACFPVSRHDDMLDSLSRIAEPDMPLVWPKHGNVARGNFGGQFFVDSEYKIFG